MARLKTAEFEFQISSRFFFLFGMPYLVYACSKYSVLYFSLNLATLWVAESLSLQGSHWEPQYLSQRNWGTSCELGVGRRQDSAFPSSSPGWPKKPHWTKPIASISTGAREQDGRSHSVCGHCFCPPRCEKGTKWHWRVSTLDFPNRDQPTASESVPCIHLLWASISECGSGVVGNCGIRARGIYLSFSICEMGLSLGLHKVSGRKLLGKLQSTYTQWFEYVVLSPSVFAELLGCVWLFATSWTVAHQAPLSLGFPRQEYWIELPFPSPGDLPNPGIEPYTISPALAGRLFTTEPPGKPCQLYCGIIHKQQHSPVLGLDLCGCLW